MSLKYSINQKTPYSINSGASLDLQSTLHIERMQNLLQEYQHENRFLNKQIIELVDIKSNIKSSTFDEDHHKKIDQHSYSAHLRNQIIADPPDKKLSHTRNTSSKKKYEYIDEGDLYQPIISTYNRYRSSSSKKISENKYSTPSKKFESIVSNIYSSELSNTKHFPAEAKTHKAKPFTYYDEQFSESITNRYVNQKEQNQLEGNTTISANPANKRYSYVQESNMNGSSFKINSEIEPGDHEENRNMEQSMKSSRKSGIKVVSSEKDLLKRSKSEHESPRKSKEKELVTKYEQPSPPKEVKHESFVEQKDKIQPLPTFVNQEEETFHKNGHGMKNQSELEIRKQLYSPPKTYESKPLEKQVANHTSIGINFKINIDMQEPINENQNRSLSQHKIAPTVKIIFSSDSVQLLPHSSQPRFKESSKEKKKFINIVSSNLLAQKLRK